MKGIMKSYSIAALISLALFFIGAYLFRDILSRHYDAYILKYFWVLMFFIFSQLLMNFVSLVLEAHQKFIPISFMEASESAIRTFAVIAAFFFGWISIASVMLLYALSKIVAVFFGARPFFECIRNLRARIEPAQRNVLLGIFRGNGKWEIARNILEQSLQPIKLTLIKVFVNIEGVAIFDFARNIYTFATNILPVRKVIFPIVSAVKDKKEVVSRIVLKSQKYSLAVYVIVYAGLLITAPFVVRYIFPQYSGSLLIVYLTSLHLFVDVYKLGQAALLYAYEKQRFSFATVPFFIAMQIFFDITFISWLGLVGVVVSWHLHALIAGIVTSYYLQKTGSINKVAIRDFLRFDEYDHLIIQKIAGLFRSKLRKP